MSAINHPSAAGTAAPATRTNANQPVVVVGGGLAGIAAAVRLAQAGVPVTLVETRKHLGGRATSFVDPTTGGLLDNCQHVLLGCCTNLLDLYRRLGVADQIVWHRTLYFADGRGAMDQLEADDLPAPFHLAVGLLRFKGLTLGEKLAIARAMLAIIRLGPTGRRRLHEISFAQWLTQQRQPAGAVGKFWSVITVGAVNELPERMAADYALQVFQDAFLANDHAYVMGLSAVPLCRLYDAAEAVICRAGGTVLLGTSAERLAYDPVGGAIKGLEIDGGRTATGGAYISAVPFDRLAKLCDPATIAADSRLARLDELEVSPIVGIHLWFAPAPAPAPGSSLGYGQGGTGQDAGWRVMDLPHLVLTQSPLHWIFNKGMEPAESWGDAASEGPAGALAAATVGEGGAAPPAQTKVAGIVAQHLHGVVSAARDLAALPAAEIVVLAVREIHKVLPAARSARLVHARVIKEKRATFSARPGVEVLRPPACGVPPKSIANLYLAGDWTATGWPATMEGAARSGYLAAAAVLDDRGLPVRTTLVSDLPPSPLCRTLRGR